MDEEKKEVDDVAAVDHGPTGVVVQLEGPLPSPSDLCERFLIYFIAKYNLSPGSRWTRDMDDVLQMEAIGFEPPVRDTLGELKQSMNARLKPPMPSSIVAAAAALVIDG